MARMFDHLSTSLQQFIAAQQMFFVATADVDGRVNLSPKGMDSFKVLSPNQVLWLNLTGSGNETAAHILAVNRMTIMFCSFAGPPLILRLYGKAKAIYPTDAEWAENIQHFPDYPGVRQLYLVDVENAQTSCGYAVPEYDFVQQRSRLIESTNKKGPEGIKAYWKEKNTKSIDGKETGMKGID